MATVLTEKEAVEQLQTCRGLLTNLIRIRREIGTLESRLINAGYTPTDVASGIGALVTDWDTLRDELVTTLGAIPGSATLYKYVITPSSYQGFTSFNVRAKNPGFSNKGTIRIDSDHEELISPFDGMFVANDVVRITNASDPAVNGRYIVEYTPGTAQVDVINNGGFNDTSDWTEASAAIVITGGVAAFTAATATLKQVKTDMAVSWTNGKRYLVTVTISGASAGVLDVGTNTTPAQVSLSSNGTYTCNILADNHADGLLFTATGFTGNLDDVSAIGWTGLAFTGAMTTDENQVTLADTGLIIALEER
jgi:hypothetical protein